MSLLAAFIYHKLLGWQIKGEHNALQNHTKKAVIVVAPHTSWSDFYICVLVRSILKLRINFIGKKELFVFPLGYFFRALGGIPVDRRGKQNLVEQIVESFDENDTLRIALSPEGTRKKVEKWRTGFYYIAKAAKVPIVMFSLDYKNKQNTFSKPFYPTDDVEADFKFIKGFFKNVEGKVADYS